MPVHTGIFFFFCLIHALFALTIPQFFSSHMVLVRDPLRARIWGWANTTDKVTLTLDSTTSWTATPNSSNSYFWQIDLDPQKAGINHQLDILGDGLTKPITFTDVAFGDVYLCSGQSNMQFSVNAAMNETAEIADSINYPHLRFFTAKLQGTSTVQNDLPSMTTNYSWGVSTPVNFNPPGETANNFSWPSAVCYFFGRDLYKALNQTVPIGILGVSWGGTMIEVWMSPDALNDKTCGGTNLTARSFEEVHKNDEMKVQDIEVAPFKDQSPDVDVGSMAPVNTPSIGWNGMLYPLRLLRINGLIWYQGEENEAYSTYCTNQSSYCCTQPALIADIRKKYNLPNLPFYITLLAASHDPLFREVQLLVTRQLPFVNFSNALDLGDPSSPTQGHPRRKQEVGRRHSLIALKEIYHQTTAIANGPTIDLSISPKVVRNTTSGNVTVSVYLKYTSGLHTYGTAACSQCCNSGQSPFQYFDPKTNYTIYAAITTMDATSGAITLNGNWTTSHPNNFELRYLFQTTPQCGLYNGKGGPDDYTAVIGEPHRLNVTVSAELP